ncbi:copper radical oxidase [Lophiostoma macrostomum CBS 122681]|uniref:Copper radical oxidase n=1 Tax=Lophiostoma macrostomum CBS 122681 TaxID=1314788 RepID=A0A6A6SU65_9PLEO|nr:copper radical oxidase [Lophiostoma macrostomum CBS 122681]
MDTPQQRGKWSEPFDLPNVGAHAHLLHTGRMLMWGRRDTPEQSMNVFPANPPVPGPNAKPADPATCTPFLLETKSQKSTTIKQPTMPDGKTNANLFCSGHTFQPDGTLLVAGGHITDGQGLDQTSVYDPDGGPNGTWKAGPKMGKGRWYPTVTALPTGAALLTSGSYRDIKADKNLNNTDVQQWSKEGIASVTSMPNTPFPLFPRIHVASSGKVYMESPPDIMSLDLASGNRQWNPVKDIIQRPGGDYGCSVMYEKDKVLFVGGGTPPMARADVLNLSDPIKIKWDSTNDMNFQRRQHNATVLPDGSVLVTGGTRGDGVGAAVNINDVRFNDLRPGRPVHIAELWNPKTGEWTMMASEQTDRCYHSTAVLLPDGRVLSAGGGEFQLGEAANDPQDSHRDAQFFSPPYLFQPGPRPQIKSISKDVIECASVFDVSTNMLEQIKTISLIGLSSVTHSINTGQRLNFLTFTKKDGLLKVDAPPNARSCPPGYHMLFILTDQGIPSEAKIVRIVATAEASTRHQRFTAKLVSENNQPPTVLDMRTQVRQEANGTRVEIGITPTCPYGLSACWGGAFKALSNLDGVEQVDPIPHASGSTASVFLKDAGLPNLDLWTKQFHSYVRETYSLRGFEATLTGTVAVRDNSIVLAADEARPEVRLVPLQPEGKVQWDKFAGRPQRITEEEAITYNSLTQWSSSDSGGLVTVTGPMVCPPKPSEVDQVKPVARTTGYGRFVSRRWCVSVYVSQPA